MSNLSYDTQRVIKAWNMKQKISICRNSKIYKLEFSDRCEWGHLSITLRSIEDSTKGIKYKIHYTEIAETLNNIFRNSAINKIE